MTKTGYAQTKIGYARVSTHEQNLSLQFDALESAGCDPIFHDQVSGSKAQRPGLDQALAFLRAGDVLVVWRLDRLGRSLKHLIEVVADLEKRGIGFQSLQESIDTTTSGGRLIFHIFGALAEFERNLIQERTRAGLAAARARGRVGGRPRALDDKKAKLLYRLYDEKQHSINEICHLVGVSRSTLFDYVRRRVPASLPANNVATSPATLTKKQRQEVLNETAVSWLRDYVDWRGYTWQELAPGQTHHANSPCYQAFVAAYPDGPDHKFALKHARAVLGREIRFG